MARSRLAEQVGRVVGGRYRLLAPVGTGASADVYVADDVTLRRRVAVKLLHDALATDEGFLKRFRAEARTVASLRHPNIMAVFDWGEEPEGPFLVLEYLSGGSLRDLLDRGHRLTPSQATLVGLEAARGLDHAHRRGLVHRDIKPANLLFDDEGRLAIADFGIARALAEATWTEPAGAVIGTARYASPEQARGGTTDGRADVYALALVLVESVTGSVPFAADSTIATLMARLDTAIPVDPELGGLGAVIAASGAVDPQDRVDAAGMIRAFETAAGTLARPAPLPLAPVEVLPVAVAQDDATMVPAVPDDTTMVAVATVPVPVAPDVTAVMRPVPPTPAPPPPPVVMEEPRKSRRWRYPWIAVGIVLLAIAVALGLLFSPLLKKPTYTVPLLTGQLFASVQAPAHFTLVENKVYRGKPFNTVLAQNPAPGKRRAGNLTLTVSVGAIVPSLTGMTSAQVNSTFLPTGLALKMVQGFSSTVAPDHVVSWTPTAPQLAGTPITVIISNGPEFVAMPDLTNQPLAQATATLTADGLGLTPNEVQAFSDTVPAGDVISTQPVAGQQADRGTPVTLTVSKGPDVVVIPDVAGKKVNQAETALTAAGLVPAGPYGPGDHVFITIPGAGQTVKRGTTVVIYTH